MRVNRGVIAGLSALAAALAFLGWCWAAREDDASCRQVRKETMREFRDVKGDQTVAYLERLAGTRRLHARFGGGFPYLRVRWAAAVPQDFIAQLAEEAILRFAGDGSEGSEDLPRLKAAVEFAGRQLARCESEAARNALRDRKLDGHFLMKDYDGAIALIEADGGIPGHSAVWRRGTAAKLRAHKALAAGDRRTAAEQFLVFGELLASDEMKDFEDSDPTTRIVYSAEWVTARNFLRVSKLFAETGDRAKAADYAARAKPKFAQALEKAKDDPKSLEALKAEMKAAGW